MQQLPRYAVMTELIKQLEAHQSWCGETHIQKAAFFLQELLWVPTGFDFILYKHGPFSFDLRDELATMRIYQLLELKPQPLPYGPSWSTTENAGKIQENYSVTLGNYRQQIEFVAAKLGPMRVGELEKLATALYLVKHNPGESDEQLAEKMHELKSHVTVEDARVALHEFHGIEREATAIAMSDMEV
ncbi:MAG: hypothetical protein ACYC7E_22410 [Armatimonadota bacterium]